MTKEALLWVICCALMTGLLMYFDPLGLGTGRITPQVTAPLANTSSHMEVIWENDSMAQVCIDGYIWLLTSEGATQWLELDGRPSTCFNLM